MIDERNKGLLNELFLYVNGESKTLDSSKGILLWGDVGTGKTTLIKIIGEALRIKKEGFKTLNCALLSTQYSAKGICELDESCYNNNNPRNRAFDELGREPNPAKHFGNDLDVMQYIFQCRYEIRHKVKTYATTNMNPKELAPIYGTFITDRFKEMFNIIEVGGESRR